MIKLENLTKIFQPGDAPAVDNLTLEVDEGDTCVLVGPSGCGKTTTMKMVNRLIEPTDGKIYVENEDVSKKNPIQLRLNIGYVIQEIGLFPHMSIAENIATVPRELRWPKQKIQERVDELLSMVGLDPELFRNRRPSDLSGGQRQRIGVARALSADPPLMLMDEPFGALDPITRSYLQNEFLRIQEKIKKTIIFVTHDIDEAIKMGTKIAIMREGKLVQYATPDELLSAPADEFVVNLIGGNYSIKRLHLIRVEEILKEPFTVSPEDSLDEAKEVMEKSQLELVLAVNGEKHLEGLVTPSSLRKEGERVGDVMDTPDLTVDSGATLNDALSVMLTNGEGYALVVGDENRLQGVVTLNAIMEALQDNEK